MMMDDRYMNFGRGFDDDENRPAWDRSVRFTYRTGMPGGQRVSPDDHAVTATHSKGHGGLFQVPHQPPGQPGVLGGRREAARQDPSDLKVGFFCGWIFGSLLTSVTWMAIDWWVAR